MNRLRCGQVRRTYRLGEARTVTELQARRDTIAQLQVSKAEGPVRGGKRPLVIGEARLNESDQVAFGAFGVSRAQSALSLRDGRLSRPSWAAIPLG